MDRRDFLVGTGSLAVLAACGTKDDDDGKAPTAKPAPERSDEPDPWDAPGTLDDDAFPFGVVIGDVTADSALLGLRTDEPAVTITAVVGVDGDWADAVELDGAPEDGFLAIELTGLHEDAVYNVVASTADGRRSAVTRFRTALGSVVRQVIFAGTSCLGGANRDWDSLPHAAAVAPDFCLLLGDTVYADGSEGLADYREEWDAAMTNPSLRAMTAATSVIATWDDHEVGNNWTIGDSSDPLVDVITEQQLADATQAFREALPQREGPKGALWRKLSWGDVIDVFVLDCRGERSDGRIVSKEQLAWATEGIRASTAHFKLVLSSVHLTDHAALLSIIEQEDRWQGYPDQRLQLIEACTDVPGVVVITGDMHFGALQRVDPAGSTGADLYEVAVGPAGSPLFLLTEIAALAGKDMLAEYEWVFEDWSTSVFVADPGTGSLTVQFIDDAGDIVFETVLTP